MCIRDRFVAGGLIKNDHFTDSSGHNFLTQAFGPRTGGQLSPWILALVPYSGGAPVIASGLWFDKMCIRDSFQTAEAKLNEAYSLF